jgi:hypothetical protein
VLPESTGSNPVWCDVRHAAGRGAGGLWQPSGRSVEAEVVGQRSLPCRVKKKQGRGSPGAWAWPMNSTPFCLFENFQFDLN